MTCIVGLVDGKDVVIGGDSAGVAGLSIVSRKDEKVFVKGEFIYGFTSSFRMGQILRYRFTEPDHDPRYDVDTYMRTIWIDTVRKCLADYGYAQKVNNAEYGGTFLVGYRGRLFLVDGDFHVAESLLPYESVGCGHDLAKGAMFVQSERKANAETKIATALAAAEQFSAGVRGPWTIERLKGK